MSSSPHIGTCPNCGALDAPTRSAPGEPLKCPVCGWIYAAEVAEDITLARELPPELRVQPPAGVPTAAPLAAAPGPVTTLQPTPQETAALPSQPPATPTAAAPTAAIPSPTAAPAVERQPAAPQTATRNLMFSKAACSRSMMLSKTSPFIGVCPSFHAFQS